MIQMLGCYTAQHTVHFIYRGFIRDLRGHFFFFLLPQLTLKLCSIYLNCAPYHNISWPIMRWLSYWSNCKALIILVLSVSVFVIIFFLILVPDNHKLKKVAVMCCCIVLSTHLAFKTLQDFLQKVDGSWIL